MNQNSQAIRRAELMHPSALRLVAALAVNLLVPPKATSSNKHWPEARFQVETVARPT
jgi:hypothetical protein